jgi:phospholipid-binding lipoprotein MlaA
MKKIIILITVFLMGCSNVDTESSKKKDHSEVSHVESVNFKLHLKAEHTMMDVYDPLEPLNRRIYYFNYEFDKWVGLPVSNSYKFFFPETARTGVKNFFANLYEPISAINGIFILDYKIFSVSIGRFLVNSTIGIAGLFDVATKIHLEEKKRTLDDTFAVYGIGTGPYLILPFLGPSNLRNVTAELITFVLREPLDPINVFTGELWEDIALLSIHAVDTRSRIPFEAYSMGTPFEYEYVRMLYLKAVKLKVKKSDFNIDTDL